MANTQIRDIEATPKSVAIQSADRSSTVLFLPTAGMPPIAQQKRRGRLPKGVTQLRWHLQVGDLARVVGAYNDGALVRITGRVPHNEWPTDKRDDVLFKVQGVEGCLVIRRKDGDDWLETATCWESMLRRAFQPAEKYPLPLWPSRWEQELGQCSGHSK